MTQHINIAKDFSPVPIGRYRRDNQKSGEAFREDVLRPAVEQAIRNDEFLEIDFDGMQGLTASFLEEAFGGLVRNRSASSMPLTAKSILKTLQFQPAEDRLFRIYIKNIKQYIQDGDGKEMVR